jgi:hypothetical protein
MNATAEPMVTSLGSLSENDWQIISNNWARGIDWVVCKVGRKWMIMGQLGAGFPNFKTKTAAHDAATNLVLAESLHRHWVYEQAER